MRGGPLSRSAGLRSKAAIDQVTIRSGSTDFIAAKLLVPSGTEASVPRRRILRRLRAAPDRRLVSIVAPPGYGKTTLLAQWATDGPREAAWLTLDDFDNDPGVFLGYLAATLDRIEPLDPSVFRAVHARSVDRPFRDRAPAVGHRRSSAPGPLGPR